jgi:myosin tail region-interacting protein MTI1
MKINHVCLPDPIDPIFHPLSNKVSHDPSSQDVSISAHEQEPSAEDEEQSRRRTIAERMARLGGIKFGAPPPLSRPLPTPRAVEDGSDRPAPSENEPSGEVQQSDEEEELARKQRIAAKIAGMGGMRFGMIPTGVSGTQHQPLRAKRQESGDMPDDNTRPPHPAPQRAVPPPRQLPQPPPVRASQDVDSEQESSPNSEDGVKVEAEESELEEVTHEDAEYEEAPPPVPVRTSRRSLPPNHPMESSPRVSQIPPVARPPVSTMPIYRKPSIPVATSRKLSADSSVNSPVRLSNRPPSFVMVDEPDHAESEEPVVAPKRLSRAPPARGPPPPPPFDSADVSASAWELPQIPNLDFGGDTDLSLSTWSELGDSESSLSAPPPPPARPASRPTSRILPPQDSLPQVPADELQLSADDLMAVWGRVGVQICEVATTLAEQSKGQFGSYRGFVDAVLNQVPNAVLPTPSRPLYGYVIYSRDGATVHKRACDIMPGDIVTISDAKLKGHKGIQTYHQTVGTDEEVVGIVGEWESKKAKIKVLEAGQHVSEPGWYESVVTNMAVIFSGCFVR